MIPTTVLYLIWFSKSAQLFVLIVVPQTYQPYRPFEIRELLHLHFIGAWRGRQREPPHPRNWKFVADFWCYFPRVVKDFIFCSVLRALVISTMFQKNRRKSNFLWNCYQKFLNQLCFSAKPKKQGVFIGGSRILVRGGGING